MDLHCPSCESSNTQNIEVAYEQSVRTSHRGFESVSEFGRKIAPPAFINPLFAGFVFGLVWVVLWFFGLTAYESYRWFKSQEDWHLFLCHSALFVSLAAMFLSAVYDILFVTKARSAWRKRTVCRRCGYVWNPTGDVR